MPIAEPSSTWLAGGGVSVTGAPTEKVTLPVPSPVFLVLTASAISGLLVSVTYSTSPLGSSTGRTRVPASVVSLPLAKVPVATPESAERFQELIASLGPGELLASEPALRQLDVPTLIVWGTDDQFFDLKWAYWLQGEIGAAYQVTEMTGAKLYFPHENAAVLAPHIQRHWNTAACALVSDAESRRNNLADALCDAIDEYRDGEASLATETSLPALTHDADATIRELARLGDPAWAAEMRNQWKIAASVLDETGTRTAQPLSPAQADQVTGALQALRSLASEPGRLVR